MGEELGQWRSLVRGAAWEEAKGQHRSRLAFSRAPLPRGDLSLLAKLLGGNSLRQALAAFILKRMPFYANLGPGEKSALSRQLPRSSTLNATTFVLPYLTLSS